MNPEQEQQPQLPQQPVNDPVEVVMEAPAKAGKKILRYFLASIPIIAGILMGAYLGFMITFASCYKSSCSPIESSAALWVPIASLFITIPIARLIVKNVH